MKSRSNLNRVPHQTDDRLQILQRFQPHCNFTNFEEVVIYFQLFNHAQCSYVNQLNFCFADEIVFC